MAFRHGKRTGIAVEGNDLTAYFNSADGSGEVATPETTTFGNDSRTYIVGHRDGTFSLQGFYDGSTDAVDDVLQPILGTEDGSHILVQQGYDAADSVGLRVQFAKAEASNYTITEPVDGVVAISYDAQADGGLFGGVILHQPGNNGEGFDFVANGASVDVSSVDNGASTANGYVAQLHVVSNSLDGNLIVTVEDSPDDAVFSTLDTFTTVAGGTTTAEQISGTGTVERYVRINIDTTAATTGAAIIAVGFSRLPATS